MEMKPSVADYWELFPILSVMDGVIVSKHGDLTIGWEMTLPEAFSLERDDIEAVNAKLVEAVKMLPPWMMLHRQDIYREDNYVPEEARSFLGQCYEEHFRGRPCLQHRQFLYLTLTSRSSALRTTSSSGLYEPDGGSVVPCWNDAVQLNSAGATFIGKLTEATRLDAREMDTEDLINAIEDYRRLGNPDRMLTDLEYRPDRVVLGDTTLWSYSISESRDLPHVMMSSRASETRSGRSDKLYSTAASAVGPMLECPHIVNTYLLTSDREKDMANLDQRKRKMFSMSSRSIENRNNAEEIEEFQSSVHQHDSMMVRTHMDVLVWTEGDETKALSRTSAAISQMGANAVRNTFDTPVLFYAGMPGAACELGEDHFMKMELEGATCLSMYETFAHGIPGGTLKLCDRLRHVPVQVDLHEAAAAAGLISNYNAFILGESGAGKSFFTNHLARSAYDNGETVFIVDMGGSYEGLCSVINDESGGKDGHYHQWSRETPLTFDGFWDFADWTDASGQTNKECPGLNFMLSFLQTVTEPSGGWNKDRRNILSRILQEFTVHMKEEGRKPVLDDLNAWLSRVKEMMEQNSYLYNGTTVTKMVFDIDSILRTLAGYCTGGPFGYLLNDPHPKDLISSRFTVFDMTTISQIEDPAFRSAVILCIMNTFSAKMNTTGGFKTLIIDEAWVAIANETMAPFLNSLWKTSRKYSTSAMVVTQQLSDIMKSSVVKDTILANSAVRAILRKTGASSIDDTVELLGLGPQEKAQVLSLNLGKDPGLNYMEVFLQIGSGHSGIWATEVSPQEAVAYQSNLNEKRPFMEMSREVGAVEAIRRITGMK